jgi:hypothetical protein
MRLAVILALGGALALVFWRNSAGVRESEVDARTGRGAPEAARPARDPLRTAPAPQPLGRQAEAPSATEVPVTAAGPAADPATSTTVATRFVDTRGNPVAGAELALAQDPAQLARSGSDGRAELRLDAALAGGALGFVARCSGFALERRTATATAGERLLLGDWVLVEAGEIAGRVVGPDGAGLAGVSVACLAAEMTDEEWAMQRRSPLASLARPGAVAVTTAAGSFRLADVPAGTWRLVAVAADRPAARSEPVGVPTGGLVSDVTIRMDTADGGTAIAGIVLDPAGSPLAHAQILLEGGGSSYRFAAGADGRFRRQMSSAKPFTLTALDPEQRHREALARDVRPGTTDLVLRLTAAPEIALSVRGVHGAPIERFGATMLPAGDGLPLYERYEDARPGGLLVLNAPAQDFRIRVRANGWLPTELGPFAAGAPPAELECVLAPAGGVTGIVAAHGRPVADAWVGLYAAATRDDTYNGFPVRVKTVPVNETTSDAEGRFALSVERAGTWYVRVEADGYAPAEIGPLALDPASAHTLRVDVSSGGTLVVRVRSADGASVAGRLVAISRGDAFARTARTDERGAVTFARLTPGQWQVALSEVEIDPDFGATYFGAKAAGEIPSNCRVFDGETTRVDLWVQEPGAPCVLLGRLTLDGEPAEGWFAGFEAADVKAFAEPGAFRLDHDEPGPQRLVLRTDASDPAKLLVLLDEVELVLGTRHWSLELATGALEGTLAPREGTALYYRWTRDTLELYAPIAPGADGRFRCARVPSGEGALVEVDPALPLQAQTPVVLRTVVVAAGRTTTLE